MRKTANEMATELEVGDIHTKGEDWGDQLRPPHRPPAGADFTPLFKGLPGDLCQCPHWGYILEGSIHVRYADGTEEVNRAGDLYYWPGGHTGWTDEGVVFIEFSPADEIRPVLEHLGAQLAPSSLSRRWSSVAPVTTADERGGGQRRRARAGARAPSRATTGRPPSTRPRAATSTSDRGRGRAARPAGRGGVVARPARRVHRRRARPPTAPTTSSATSRRAGQCAVWLCEHHAFERPTRHRRRLAAAGPPGARGRRRVRRATAASLLREAETAHGGGELDAGLDAGHRGARPRPARCGRPTSRPRRCRPRAGSSSTRARSTRAWATSTRRCCSPSRAGSARTRPARCTAA